MARPTAAFAPSLPLPHKLSTSASALHVSRPSVLPPLPSHRVAAPTLTRRHRVSPRPGPKAPRASAASSGDVPLGRDSPLGPATGFRFSPARWFEGLRGDVRRRAPLYLSDWTEGLRPKSIPVVLFMFFACFAPITAFGALNSLLTGGNLGVVECILSAGISGIIFAAMSAQPLTIQSPTGLTLAFTGALYGFTSRAGLPFMPFYGWVGVWTSVFLLILTVINASDMIKHCTRWTDDIFNGLIATNFLYEAAKSLLAGFRGSGADKTLPFTTLALALGTLLCARALAAMRSSRFFFKRARDFLADFGPILSIALMSAVAALPAVSRLGLEKLSIPPTFALAGGRPWLLPLLTVPWNVRLLCMVPAALLTVLFFMDQNITGRVVGTPSNKLRKGPGFHLDLLSLSVTTFICSIIGLPLMCAGTIQSLSHVRACTSYEQVVDDEGRLTGEERIASVMENRVTPLLIHVLILSSLILLPVLKLIPVAVTTGIFLLLGLDMLPGNQYISRLPVLFMDTSRYPSYIPRNVAPSQTNLFTLLQTVCFATLWVLKLNKKTAMYFPTVIALCMVLRLAVAPKLLKAETLAALDGSIEDE